jgi:Protein of unknown function (DUF1761)
MIHKRLQRNYWAVLVVGLSAFLLSMLWYSPIAFGPVWEKYRNAPNPNIPHWTLVFAPLRELIASLVVSTLIVRLHLSHWTEAAKLMVVLWFSFHAVGMAGAILWDNMPWPLGAIHAGDWLMKLLFMGVALTRWLTKNK